MGKEKNLCFHLKLAVFRNSFNINIANDTDKEVLKKEVFRLFSQTFEYVVPKQGKIYLLNCSRYLTYFFVIQGVFLPLRLNCAQSSSVVGGGQPL